jgi:hypothetical protein
MPLIYSGPPDVVADLIALYRGSLPGDIASQSRALDDAHVFAEIVALGEGTGAGWGREARLSTSHGFWLDQHAHDRGLSRQSGEADQTLIDRLKTGPKAVTLDPITEAVATIVHGADPSAVFYIVRIPVDLGAFADTDCWCDADSRVTPTRPRITIVLIPASLDGIKSSILDALRSKMPAGHGFGVEEF